VLFGTMSPIALRPHNRARAAVAQWSANRLRGARALAGLSVREGVTKLVEPVRTIVSDGGLAEAPPADEYTARRLSVEAATLTAANRYRPEPYDGDVTLFLASEADKQSLDRPLDWAGYVRGAMAVFCGPAGCDGDTMLKEGPVGMFAEQLARRLEDTAPRTVRGAHA